MTRKYRIKPSEKVGLTLRPEERTLLLAVTGLPPEYERLLKRTQPSESIMLTLDELDELGCYIAAEANYAKDRKLQRKLKSVFKKTYELLETHTDEQPIEMLRPTESTRAKLVAGAEKPVRKRSAQLFQFRITLHGTVPPIWRRIQVRDCTLDKLHEHIQKAMGWTNSHLHHFEIEGQLYGDPLLMEENFEEWDYEDSTCTKLSELLAKHGKRLQFAYEYDFGDDWKHEVLFEGFAQAQPGVRYPLCLEGGRACPPEDVGGVHGYADYLEALGDPKHEQHRECMAWRGPFDPEAFDPIKMTNAMRRGLPNWRG